ncbi:DUF6177 family protein [Arthrobacter sp. NPDC056691]|uniref:DUF6177 family protein n=1 Tax=Arthrobacter sp. NPDC056691 TaxID=3345913 RepID=UPI00366D809E
MSGAPLAVVRVPGRRPWLSRTLLARLREAAQGAAGLGIVTVQTERTARPSYPMLAFLRSAGIPWVTPGAAGLEDGFAGAPLPEGHTPCRATVIRGSVLHEASAGLKIGDFTERLLGSCVGLAPLLMDDSEPLGRAWDPDRLTTWLRQRMPLACALVAGAGFAGTVTAYRTESGVVEAFDVLAERDGEAVPAAAAAAAAAVEANVQELSIERHFGADGPGVGAGMDRLRMPELLVLGPGRHLGIPVDPEVAAVATAELAGVAPFQHLVVRYRQSGEGDLGRARDVQHKLLFPAAG